MRNMIFLFALCHSSDVASKKHQEKREESLPPLSVKPIYWSAVSAWQVAKLAIAAPAGSNRITPDSSVQNERCPDWPTDTGTAVATNDTLGSAIVPTAPGTG